MADRVSRSVLEFTTTGVDQVTGAYDKVERKAKQTGDSVTSLSQRVGSLTTAFQGFLALAIVQRVAQIAGSIVDAVDQFDTLAGRINDTTDNIQRLQAVSQEYDVSLESLVDGIQEMQRRLGDPPKEFLAALSSMNLSVTQLKALAPTDAYLAMADALGRIEDPATRAATAQDALGRAAKGTANAFREGVDQVDAWVKISPQTIAFVDSLKVGFDKGSSALLAFTAELAANVSGWNAWSFVVEHGRSTLNALLLDAKNFRRYIDQEMGRDVPAAPATPSGLVPQIQLVRDLTKDEKELKRVEDELTRTARDRIEANKEALKATEDRSRAEREYYNWVGEREIAAIAAMQDRVEREQAAWRAYYNWLGERRMENEAAELASQLRIAAGAQQMFQMMMSGGAAWNGTGAWMNRPTVPMDSPTASGGGGWWSRMSGLFGGNSRWAGLAGGGLGMLSGLIPGQSRMGSALGSMAGSFLGPLGGALGGLVGGLFGRLFGPSEATKTSRARNEWLESIGGAEQLRQRAAAAGVSLERMFSTRKVKDFEAEAKRVMAAIEAHEQKVLALQEEMQGLEAERARLEAETTVTADQMQSISDRFGIDQNALGQQFQQKRLGADAKELIDAIEVMRKGGAEMNVVYLGMREEISALIQDSVKFGTEIPENLKPVIESLFEQGALVDANGEKLKELPNIKFGAAIKSEMEKASDKLAEVVERLAEVLAQLTEIDGKKATFDVEGRYRAEEDTPSRREGGEGYKVGTLGRTGSFWQDFGRATRTVLHGVEAVVRPDQAVRFARSVLGAAGEASDTPLVLMMDGQVAARAMIRRTGRSLALVGA